MKIWTCESSPRSGSQNAWMRIKNVNGASRLRKFWNFFFGAIQMISCRARLVTMDETWLYHYDPETKRHSGSRRPQKNSECKNPLEKFSPRFFGIKTAFSSLIILPRGKISTRSVIHLCWCNWRTFWRKNAAERSPRWSCSCTTMPWLTRHLQPRRNWSTWASNVSITHPILLIWSRRTTTCSLDWKNNWKIAIFLPTRRSFLPRRPGWTDKLLIFFWVTCKSYGKGLRSVLLFVGSMLNKSRVWLL